jgi:hypothetical protein
MGLCSAADRVYVALTTPELPASPGALLMYAFYAIVAVIVTVLVLNFIEYKRVD